VSTTQHNQHATNNNHQDEVQARSPLSQRLYRAAEVALEERLYLEGLSHPAGAEGLAAEVSALDDAVASITVRACVRISSRSVRRAMVVVGLLLLLLLPRAQVPPHTLSLQLWMRGVAMMMPTLTTLRWAFPRSLTGPE
jgi:hypothetical protein